MEITYSQSISSRKLVINSLEPPESFLKRRYRSFGRMVIERQKELGIKNLDLNMQMGFNSPNMISSIRRGACKPPEARLERLAQLLELECRDAVLFYFEEFRPDMYILLLLGSNHHDFNLFETNLNESYLVFLSGGFHA